MIELRKLFVENQMPFEKCSGQWTQALVHDELSDHQQGNNDQEANMHFQIKEEGNPDVPIPGLRTLHRGEDQQRHPSQQRKRDDALAYHQQGIV